jgi:hypothetical protein
MQHQIMALTKTLFRCVSPVQTKSMVYGKPGRLQEGASSGQE